MEVINDIYGGRYDKELEALYEAVRTRRKAVGAITALSVKPGDRVQIVEGISPKMFAGIKGTVTGHQGRVNTTIELDISEGQRWRFNRYLKSGTTQANFRPGAFELIDG